MESIKRAYVQHLVSLAAFAIVTVATLSREAHAQPGAPPEPPSHSRRAMPAEATTVPLWYGYQIVIADFFGASLLATGLASLRRCGFHNCDATMSGIAVASGATLYALGGPSIHAARGHWGRATGSFALRVLPIAAGNAVSDALATEGVVPLLVLGAMASAMAVDSTVLGYETVATDSSKVTFAPTYDPKSRSGAIVWAATF